MRKTIFILFVFCLVFAECKSEVQASSLEQRCKELSKPDGYEYHIVSGEVLKAGVVPSNTRDCTGGCSEHLQTWFFSVMKPLNGGDDNSKKKFTVYTKPEPKQPLLNKKPYMVPGKHYIFCARGPEEGFQEIIYRLDDVETIQELK